jgi:ribose-phosphate pyrophosphokinase
MMLVGDVADRTAILIDDMADTCNTITRAAKLLKKEGATKVYALVTHGILSGDAIERLKASALDKVVVTNSVDQREHKQLLGEKLEVLEVGYVFAEVGLFKPLTLDIVAYTSTGNPSCPPRREYQRALPL